MKNEQIFNKFEILFKKISKKNILQFTEFINRKSNYNNADLFTIISKTLIIFLFFSLITFSVFATENLLTEEITEENTIEVSQEEIQEEITQEDYEGQSVEENTIIDLTEINNNLALLNHITYTQTALLLGIAIYLFLRDLLERRKV